MVCLFVPLLTKTTRGLFRCFPIFSCLRLTVREKKWLIARNATCLFLKNDGCPGKNEKMSSIRRKKPLFFVPQIGYDVLVPKIIGKSPGFFEKKGTFLDIRPKILKNHV